MQTRPRELDSFTAAWDEGYLAAIKDAKQILLLIPMTPDDTATIHAALDFLLESEE